MNIPGRLLQPAFAYWRHAARDILLSAVAATLGWALAEHLFGHAQPVFAAIAAVVCLAPGVASHGRQATGMIAGVALGILAGLVGLRFPEYPLSVRSAAVTMLAMFAAASFGLNAVMVIQSAASAIIVVGTGHASAGVERLADAAAGGALGLIFSQVLFTPDAVAAVERDGAAFLRAVAAALRATAAGAGDEIRDAVADVRQRDTALRNAVASAAAIRRGTLRGRLEGRRIDATVAAWDGPTRDLAAAATLLGSVAAPGDEPAAVALEACAARCDAVARGVGAPSGATTSAPRDATVAALVGIADAAVTRIGGAAVRSRAGA